MSRLDSFDAERRSGERIALLAEVTLASDSCFFTDLTGDISSGGVFVATYHAVPIGTRVAVQVTLDDSVVLVTHGVVRWRRDAGSGAPPGLGVAFDTLAEASARAIAQFSSARPPLFHEDP